MSLFPTFTPLRGARLTEQTPRYPIGFQWDFDQGDLALDGAGRVIEADGYTAWVIWCVKACAVERYAFPIYNRQYGTEMEAVHNRRSRPEGQAMIMRSITEALKIDPRTKRVINFRFENDPNEADSTTVHFIVEPMVGSSIQIRLLVRLT